MTYIKPFNKAIVHLYSVQGEIRRFSSKALKFKVLASQNPRLDDYKFISNNERDDIKSKLNIGPNTRGGTQHKHHTQLNCPILVLILVAYDEFHTTSFLTDYV